MIQLLDQLLGQGSRAFDFDGYDHVVAKVLTNHHVGLFVLQRSFQTHPGH